MADKALVMGINNYLAISDLRGCENDVHNVVNLLTQTYGFDPNNIRQLMSKEVTKQAVLDGFDWLVDGTSAGDRLVMHFSGHGSYIESEDDDEAIDELICLYDMNFNAPDTYLLDDELGRLTARIPAGVRLTIILDTCHSGTGTRVLRTTRSITKAPRVILADTAGQLTSTQRDKMEREIKKGDSDTISSLLEDPTKIILARIYDPMPNLSRPRGDYKVRKFGRSLSQTRSGKLNHQLLAGAMDTQTAADAYIDDDFHGAFTYHLCQAARQAATTSTLKQVINSAKNAIQQGGYSQIPQNEGPFEGDPLFGPRDTALQPVVDPDTKGLEDVDTSEELLQHMLRVAEKFIDLADRLLETPSDRKGEQLAARASNEYVVYVHGISRHEEDYSVAWWNAMKPHLTRTLQRREVLWSPVVNERSLLSQDRALSPEAQKFEQDIEMILADRLRQSFAELPSQSRGAAPSPRSTVRGAGFSIDDFTRYMFNQDEREQILQIFDDIVRPLLEAGATVHVISHSWGTVVSWEGLRLLDGDTFPGHVANLFVVGSALSLGPVQANLFGRIGDGIRPKVVENVYNLDAQGDLVGGTILGDFAITQEYLRLPPVGCSTLLTSPSCAHSSYFRSQNVEVNRDIFARLIND